MKKKNKYGQAWDILDGMWDKFVGFRSLEDKKVLDTLTWSDFVNSCSPADTEDYIKEIALNHFHFEVKYLLGKPNRDTMKHLYGEHAFLYDVYGCKIHRFQCVTHDDYRYNNNSTIFCPECNRGIMLIEKQSAYENIVEGKYLNLEEWKAIEKLSKWHKDYQRKSNFRYQVKKLTEKGYLKYRINDLFKKLFGKKK
jgi:hypothetical protein